MTGSNVGTSLTLTLTLTLTPTLTLTNRAKLEFHLLPQNTSLTLFYTRIAGWVECLEEYADQCFEAASFSYSAPPAYQTPHPQSLTLTKQHNSHYSSYPPSATHTHDPNRNPNMDAQREGERLASLAAAIGFTLELPLPPPANVAALHPNMANANPHSNHNPGDSRGSIKSTKGLGFGVGVGVGVGSISVSGVYDGAGNIELSDDNYVDPYLGTIYGPHEPYGLHAMEQEPGWVRLDKLQTLLNDCQDATAQARAYAEQAANGHLYNMEDRIISAITLTQPLARGLAKLLLHSRPLSPEAETEAAQPLHGGTALLTSDLVFHLPCPEDGLCIASLVVRIGYTPLVRAIYRTWPALTLATQRSDYEEAEVAVALNYTHSHSNPHPNPNPNTYHGAIVQGSLKQGTGTFSSALKASLTSISMRNTGTTGTSLTQGTDYLSTKFVLRPSDSSRLAAADIEAQLDHTVGVGSGAKHTNTGSLHSVLR